MKRMTKYVAFDVQRATTVASVQDDSGRVLARRVLETHGPSIAELLRGMCGAMQVEVGHARDWEPRRRANVVSGTASVGGDCSVSTASSR